MAVAFPAGYNLSRDSQIDEIINGRLLEMSDGSVHAQILGDDYVVIAVTLEYQTRAEMQAIYAFLKTNRYEKITWTIDGIDYIGRVLGSIRRGMTGNLYTINFTYRGEVNAS
jgi:hypothetical protein